ncbi:MAG: FixH family protein [Magnetococcales bacterium]|nr:FixH family protein [Magnetococcales bacterium]
MSIKQRIEPWPVAIILFFVVVFIANFALVYLAQSSWTGLTTENHYEKGLAYNDVIAAQQAQNAMEWHVDLVVKPLEANRDERLVIRILDRQDMPVTGVEVDGVLFRPVPSGYDKPLKLVEQDAGVYATDLKIDLAGNWDVKLAIHHSGGLYRFHRAITVKGHGKN